MYGYQGAYGALTRPGCKPSDGTPPQGSAAASQRRNPGSAVVITIEPAGYLPQGSAAPAVSSGPCCKPQDMYTVLEEALWYERGQDSALNDLVDPGAEFSVVTTQGTAPGSRRAAPLAERCVRGVSALVGIFKTRERDNGPVV